MIILKPFDVVVALKIGCNEYRLRVEATEGSSPSENTVQSLADELYKGKSEVSRSITRLLDLGLVAERRPKPSDRVAGNRKLYALNRQMMSNFLIHGIKWVFKPESTGYGRGTPTGWSSGLLNTPMNAPDVPLVWPSPGGPVSGEYLEPLYPNCFKAAKHDKSLYAVLALIDVIRTGKPRELQYANQLLEDKIMELHS